MNYLQKYSGKDTRHDCPSCKAKLSFTQYLDGNTHKPIHDIVGKCNRESKCGYHYTPKQYFIDNPSRRDEECLVLNHPSVSKNIAPPQPIGTIQFRFVENSASYKSNFVRFLCEFLTVEQMTLIGENYALGATKNKEVIFWQIDIHGKVRTGKIMQYNPETGRRLKHESGAIDWVHNKLKKSKNLLEDFNLQQCFFGEHLLKIYLDKPVAIVESEKSALIASAVFPDLVWLGAGNLHGLSSEKAKVLKGRNVTLFPDLGGFEKWSDKAMKIEKECYCKINTSTLLEDIATPEAKANGFDIADYIIEELRSPLYSNSQKVEFLSPNTNKVRSPSPETQKVRSLSPLGESPRRGIEGGESTHRGIEVREANGQVIPEIQSYFSPTLQTLIEKNKALLVLINGLQLEEI